MTTGWIRSTAELLCLVWLAPVSAQEPKPDPSNDVHLEKLSDANVFVRLEAIRELHTSLDPRLPEALLPLLSDEGNSVKRLAARAVGSRYHQIPEHRVPAYLDALKPLAAAKDEQPDVANMAVRAIGLLTRKYDSDMFSPSPDGKWVIYERHGLPCLLDIERKNEELIGWNEEESGGWFSPAWSNGPVKGTAFWDSKSRAVALDITTSRKSSTIWIWKSEGSNLITLATRDILKGIGAKEDQVFSPGGFFVTPWRWAGDEFQFGLYYATQNPPDGEIIDHNVSVGWNLKSSALRQIPDSDLPEESERP